MAAHDPAITQWLHDVDTDPDARQRLMSAVYDELYRLASGYMRRERPGHTLQASALVNEAYLRLVGHEIDWESRRHFYVTAAQTMRRILIDHSRRRASEKRAGQWRRVTFDEGLPIDGPAEDMLDLDAALDKLATLDPRQAQIVELRFFAGLTVEETAASLGISEKTVKRDWAVARAWLEGELAAAE
jgi:RNA polymerase sigma factor (TIGR02999 family)